MITVIQQAKFFLMREKCLAVQQDSEGVAAEIVSTLTECGPIQPAIIEVSGLRLHSATPKSAADAAKINEAIARIHQALPPIIP